MRLVTGGGDTGTVNDDLRPRVQLPSRHLPPLLSIRLCGDVDRRRRPSVDDGPPRQMGRDVTGGRTGPYIDLHVPREIVCAWGTSPEFWGRDLVTPEGDRGG